MIRLIFINMVFLSCLINSYPVFAQIQDTLYSYDVLSLLRSNKDMNKIDKGRESIIYDEQNHKITDSVNYEVVFQSDGKMAIKKFFNGIIYIEGQYGSIDSSSIQEFESIDPMTNIVTEKKLKLINYMGKCGAWKFYVNGKLMETLYFNKCN